MSMLAAPRRKQKVINLRAKNNEWSNDTNKFGQRMLEKMGWSSGKGLGAKENGIVDHVIARYKNDEKGLGFEDKNDQWTKHEDDFNSLLANLSNANDNKIQLHSGVSLEDKSKKSKARIHYHKFTRGKDLSRYSEKDLANIFGKKSFKDEKKIEAEEENDNTTSTEQVFTEKGSMEDYFKSKMAAFKNRNNMYGENNVSDNNSEIDDACCGFQGFLGTTNDNDKNSLEFNKSYIVDDNDVKESHENDCETMSVKSKKKKKKKKNREENLSNLSENSCEYIIEDNNTNVGSKRKHDSQNCEKKKQKMSSLCKLDKDIIEQDNENECDIKKVKKKKKKKNKDQ